MFASFIYDCYLAIIDYALRRVGVDGVGIPS